MEIEQIEIYEYCKKYLKKLDTYTETLPFKSQEFGCGSKQPNIEYELENIHKKMYSEVFNAMHNANKKVNEIIKNI